MCFIIKTNLRTAWLIDLASHIYPERASNWHAFGPRLQVWHNNTPHPSLQPYYWSQSLFCRYSWPPSTRPLLPPPSPRPSLLFALPVSLEGSEGPGLRLSSHRVRHTIPCSTFAISKSQVWSCISGFQSLICRLGVQIIHEMCNAVFLALAEPMALSGDSGCRGKKLGATK